MSIVKNSEQVRRKAQAAVATARLSGYRLISRARTEQARVTARALTSAEKSSEPTVKASRKKVA